MADSIDLDTICPICLENNVDSILLPCNHGLCRSCVDGMVKHKLIQRCSICNGTVEKVITDNGTDVCIEVARIDYGSFADSTTNQVYVEFSSITGGPRTVNITSVPYERDRNDSICRFLGILKLALIGYLIYILSTQHINGFFIFYVVLSTIVFIFSKDDDELSILERYAGFCWLWCVFDITCMLFHFGMLKLFGHIGIYLIIDLLYSILAMVMCCVFG